jgi:hypothetical protein
LALLTMETLELLGISIGCLAVGGAMVFYELARIKAKRPILHGSPAVDFYYVTYLLMFALGMTFGAKAIIG